MIEQDKKKLINSLLIAGLMLASMWLVFGMMWILGIEKTSFANIPRHVFGLLGIFTSPLVHDDFSHLLSNSGPFFLFLAATLYFYRRAALKATLGIWLLSGIWVWLMAHAGAHIGASGVVYGLGAFLFFSGVFRRDVRSIAVSLLIALVYGSMVWGVFPGKQGISWESHLFGALAGIGMAWIFRKVDVPVKKRYDWENEPIEHPHDEYAEWNYQKNWPSAQNIYVTGEQAPKDWPQEG